MWAATREERNKAMMAAKEEEPQDFGADLFLALLRDDQILMDGHDLDEAIAETERQSRPNGGQDGAAADELLMRLDMEGEDPVSDAEGDDNEEEEEEWPPRDPNAPPGKQSGSSTGLTASMMKLVEKMARQAEQQVKRRGCVAVTSSRLNQGLSFNVNEWSSEELKELYDGVKRDGTSKNALVRLFNHSEYIRKTRTIEDVYAKIDDMRAMNSEHKGDSVRAEKLDAHVRGALRFQDAGKLSFIWSEQMQKLHNSRNFSRRHEYVRDQLSKFFTELFKETDAVATIDEVTGGPYRPIRWSRLYRIARYVFSSTLRIRNLPNKIGINAMEAATLMLAMSDVQKQARANLTERTRAENGLMFLKLARQDYRLFNLDNPVKDYAKAFLDPLRLREWRAVETEETPEPVETYDQMFPVEQQKTSPSKGKKRVRMADGDDLIGELDAKRPFVDDQLRDAEEE